MDKEILYWQNRSKSVPSRDLESIAEELKKGGVLNPKTIDDIIASITKAIDR